MPGIYSNQSQANKSRGLKFMTTTLFVVGNASIPDLPVS
jgi:hypothetical protein